jgi:cell division septation protein DedD
MKEENKLLVFDKKEILILIAFLIILVLASFVYGVKIGKDYSFSNSDVTTEEVKKLEVLSASEEKANTYKKERKILDGDNSYNLLKKKIDEELKKTSSNNEIKKEVKSPVKDSINNNTNLEKKEILPSSEGAYYANNDIESENKKTANVQKKELNNVVDSKAMEDVYRGTWTIQLSSHKNLKDAKIFSNNFKVRGYNPIINQVDLGDKGVWYRVSIGSFSTLVEAKNYVIKENDIFTDLDHVFIQFE